MPEVGFAFARAFNDLSTCRSFGMGVGPIPWRDAVHYADRLGLEGGAALFFLDVIRELDRLYLLRLERERDATKVK